MNWNSSSGPALATLLFLTLFSISGFAQNIPDLSGTWSDPPPRAEDAFCHIGCAIEAREYFTQLLNDPANIDFSYTQLRARAQGFQNSELIPSHLTAAASEQRSSIRNARPRVASCDPWGLVRTTMAPHAMELNQYETEVTLYYSEWTVFRTVYLDGRERPVDGEPRIYGFSVGHYEGDSLVVETTGISANNFGTGGFTHSDQLSVTERFSRKGGRLEIEVILTDPLTLEKPLHMARAWAWAPGEEIYPYDSCVVPEA
mgnify:CR=1 FL=1